MDIEDQFKETGIGTGGAAGHARFTFIDLLAGIGGFRIGLERIGGRCVYALERERFARKTYAAWFGAEPEGCDMNHTDLGSFPVHDILTAGFPCPSFSQAGVSTLRSMGRAHGLKDADRGQLFFRLTAVLASCRPPAFIFENVENLLRHDKGRTWGTMHSRLCGLGYSVFADVLDARHFGVPQHRERVFIVGFDNDRFGAEPAFQFPEPLCQVAPTLRSILEPHPDPTFTLTDGTWRFLKTHKRKHAAKGNGFGYSFASLEGITNTLSARYGKDGSEILIHQPGRNPRMLTLRETARLMGFPDHLPIVVSKRRAYHQFGNAVVPTIIEKVGMQALKTIERQAHGD
ncbi:MAG: DNA (cytosine-5-)-methyltransferase [Phycisphaerae bacterium]